MPRILKERNYGEDREYQYRVWGPSEKSVWIPSNISISDTELMKSTYHSGSIVFDRDMEISHIEIIEKKFHEVIGRRYLSNNIMMQKGDTLEVEWQLDISIINRKVRIGT